MAEALVPTPIERPDIVVPDAAPLIHLAAGLLHPLQEVGAAVVVVDTVAQEVTRDPSKPGAEILREWLARGRGPGSDRPVRIEDTETGRLPAAVLETRTDADIDGLTTRAFLDAIGRRDGAPRSGPSSHR